MTTRPRLIVAVLAAIVLLCASYVNAGILAIDFPGDLANFPACTSGCHNTTADDFRISPSHHYDTAVVFGLPVLPGIGWDGSGGPNPDYLGPPFRFGDVALYIDHNGLSFSLLSLESLGESLVAESSKGGVVTIPQIQQRPSLHFDFVGPEWRDIQWVVFFYLDSGGPLAGFNELVVFVPGPPTFGLFGLGTLIFAWRLRPWKRRPIS